MIETDDHLSHLATTVAINDAKHDLGDDSALIEHFGQVFGKTDDRRVGAGNMLSRGMTSSCHIVFSWVIDFKKPL